MDSAQGPVTAKQCREAARVFNRAGAALAKHGIKFYYHNHGYEFQPYEQGTLFDLLVTETDPKTVFFQMDVLWTVLPGQDPVRLLEKYPDRWLLMHLKDLKKGVPTGSLTGGTALTNDVALGTGQVQWPALFPPRKRPASSTTSSKTNRPRSSSRFPAACGSSNRWNGKER